MNILNILTTATPRPELHNSTIIPAVEALFKSDIDKINWYVNIDCPSMFTEENRKATENNFLSFFRPGLKTTILADHQAAHFGAAARRLYNACEPEKGNNVFLWLEDDWILKADQYFFDALNNYFTSQHNFFLCSIAWYVTGNPFFFRQEFFRTIKNKYSNIEKNIDPELMLFECVKDTFKVTDPRITPPNSIHKQYFFDAGRQWRADRNIQKLDKYQTHFKEVTWN